VRVPYIPRFSVSPLYGFPSKKKFSCGLLVFGFGFPSGSGSLGVLCFGLTSGGSVFGCVDQKSLMSSFTSGPMADVLTLVLTIIRVP